MFYLHPIGIIELLQKIANEDIKLPRLNDPKNPMVNLNRSEFGVVQILNRIRHGLPIGVALLEDSAVTDGDQLVATVWEIFHPRYWILYYDLADKKFVKTGYSSHGRAQDYHLLPICGLIDTMSYLKFIRGLSEEFIQESDEIAKSIREYRIPFYVQR